MNAVVRSGVGRHRVQTVVIVMASFLAVTAAVLAGSLLVASSAPFDRSFSEQHGAHLSVLFRGAGDVDQAPGVAETSGPFPVVVHTAQDSAGPRTPPLTIAGRAQPTTGIDRVSLVEGRWATGPGEIVIAGSGPRHGTTLVFDELPGQPKFTVVGVARSISRTADAWVVPSAIAALTSPGTTPDQQMLYRLSSSHAVDAARSAITAAAPSGSVLGSQSWLNLRQSANRTTALFVPFLIAFGVLGLIMAVLSVAGVIAGTVGSATLRIGVLKAMGFTPGQVVRSFLAQALIPSGIGMLLGVVAGNLLTVPVLRSADEVYGSAPSAVEPWVDAVVVAGALLVVTATAWMASWRAGRLRTAEALTVGRAPAAGRGRWAAALGSRVPLPRPISLGLGQPFARPGRMVAMLATIVFGAASVSLAVGLAASLSRVETARTHDTAAVEVGPERQHQPGPGPGGTTQPDPAAVSATIGAQHGTTASYGIAQMPVAVAGLNATVDLFGYSADPSWAGFRLTRGRWFTAPGEAIVPTTLLTATNAQVGDTLTLNVEGHRLPVRVVGEVFSTQNDGMQVFTDLRTVTAQVPDLKPEEYRIAVAAGTDLDAYIAALDTAVRPLGLRARANEASRSDVLLALNTLTGFLTVTLVAVAALGVLNALVLQTRERVRELGIHKAVGMTPRQAVTMVLSSVVLVGLAGGAIGVPLGTAVHGVLLPAMGDGAGVHLPTFVLDVYRPLLLAALIGGGLAIAVVGALLPAGWAARVRTATALRTE